MANYNKLFTNTNIRLGEVRFSFLNVFEPKPGLNGGDPKYSTMVLIPKENKEAVDMFKAAIIAAEELGQVNKWGGKIPRNVKTPLRDGDEERPDDPSCAGMYFFNCSSKNAPGIRVKDGNQIREVLEDSDIYSGMWGAVTINLYPYSAQGSNGVAVGLGNIIKTRDDEKFGGGRTADADFADMK